MLGGTGWRADDRAGRNSVAIIHRGAPVRAPLFFLAKNTPGESLRSGDGGWPPPTSARMRVETLLTHPAPEAFHG